MSHCEGMPVMSWVRGDKEVGDDYESMPVVSQVCRGDSSGNKELDVAGRPVV